MKLKIGSQYLQKAMYTACKCSTCTKPDDEPRQSKYVALIDAKTWLCQQLQFIELPADVLTHCTRIFNLLAPEFGI